jgi:MFS family permease
VKTFERWTMLAAILGTSMVFLDGTVMNLALPKIGAELPASVVSKLEGQTYAVSGYLAILAALLILAGALGDYYGRRRVFAIGLTGLSRRSCAASRRPSSSSSSPASSRARPARSWSPAAWRSSPPCSRALPARERSASGRRPRRQPRSSAP